MSDSYPRYNQSISQLPEISHEIIHGLVSGQILANLSLPNCLLRLRIRNTR